MLIRFGSLEYVFLFAVSPCVNNPCENNGTCSVDVNGNATCTCDGNWNGTYCQGMYILRLKKDMIIQDSIIGNPCLIML
jgi:hypothetical protein